MEITLKQMMEVKKDLYKILSNHTEKKYSEIEKDANSDY
jgi:ATP-dependent Clp protease protease subunit